MKYFEITTPVNQDPDSDFQRIATAVNQGIDARLEGFTESEFTVTEEHLHHRLNCNIAMSELPVLIRRLLEQETEEAELLANDIVTVAYGVEL